MADQPGETMRLSILRESQANIRIISGFTKETGRNACAVTAV